MTTVQEQPFYHRRAVQLAVVYLTRRDDLHVSDSSEGVGVDLLVSLQQHGKDEGKLFGIEVIASWPSSSGRSAKDSSKRKRETYRYLPMPVCAFQFQMQDDHAEWYWLREPIRNGELVTPPETRPKPLDNPALEDIVSRINDWYESRIQSALLVH